MVEVITAPVTPVVTPPAMPPVTPPAVTPDKTGDDSTLLGGAGKETPVAETEAQKTARLADEDRILKADEKSLKPEELAKRKELLEAKSNVIPENYEIKVPEGMTLEETTIKEFSPALKELKITQGQMQGLIDKVYAPLIKRVVDASHQESMATWKKEIDGWKVESQKVLGSGEAGKQNLAIVGKAVMTFGGEEFRQMADDTGVGNHPAFVNFMLKVGKAISQDKFVDPNKTTTPQARVDPKKFYATVDK